MKPAVHAKMDVWTSERWLCSLFVDGWMDGWRDGWSGAEVDGVNWFVRANELSPVNQGLMGYPGTCNLVRELEQVRQNMRHTWHTAEAETRTGSRVKVLSRLFFFLSKLQICLLEIFSSPFRSNERERERGREVRYIWMPTVRRDRRGGFFGLSPHRKESRDWSSPGDDLAVSAFFDNL